MTQAIQKEISAVSQAKTLRTFRPARLVLWGGSVAIAIYLGILVANWPFTESNLVETLHARSLRTVTIEHFHRTYFPPGCVADGIRFLRIKHPDKPALLTIRQLVVEDNYPALLLCQRRLSSVKLIGLHLVVPAKEPPGEPSPVMPLTYSDPASATKIGSVSADGAVLEFLSEQPGFQPLRLVVRKLSLNDVGGQTPISYQTEIYNPKPSGDIKSNGSWGPWDPHHPGATAVRGTYEYQNVRLSSLPDLNGTLESRGTFNGTLAQINVVAEANVSDFRMGNARHSSPFKANFQAAVNAIKGDVRLNQVQARLNRTVLVLSGSIAGGEQQTGKTVTLTVNSSKARVEDLFGLFSAENQPPMSGNIAFQGDLSVPPGNAPVLQRMSLRGTFGIDAGLFSDNSTEREMAKLSVSAVRGDKEEDRENPQTVLMNVKGRVETSSGVARLKQMSFNVPGAQATLTGTFSLEGYQSNMHGVLMTTGDVADATTGIKSIFLKALTPFFKHHSQTKVVPFKVTGPLGKTTVSLDLGSKKNGAAGRN